MFLKQIELQGFKSFADKTILRFDQTITGIVGPNGCGKSNVNDAIRWVLGEQSAKSLRSGSSMSDIIFSGSAVRKSVNLARVTLVFDNTNRVFNINYDEVEITRQISRASGESGFFINRSPCRLKDITELVMDTGLGRDSLSIITQGNISSFADAKPEERRLLFEEAAGVAKYKKRKKVSLAKLEKLQENLDRLQDIMDELESRLGPLKKQAEKAMRYSALKDELSALEISVLCHQAEQAKKKMTALKEQILELENQVNLSQSSLEDLEEKSQSLRHSMYALDGEISSMHSAKTDAMNSCHLLEKQKIEIEQRRQYLIEAGNTAEKRAALKEALSQAEFEYRDRSERLAKIAQDVKARDKEMNVLNSRRSQAARDLAAVREQLHQVQSRISVLKNQLAQPYAHQQGVKAVMQGQRYLTGIEGVVTDLLEPAPDMAQAISSALGGAVYQIVTSDEASARQAIGYLKRNRAGRATFIPLSVCKGQTPSALQTQIASQSPGFIGWASSLVENSPRYNELKLRLLGKIAVCDTLENANVTARNLGYKLKVVTQEGDVVHAGGSMTGGSTKVQSSPLTIKHEAAALEKKEAEVQKQLDNLLKYDQSLAADQQDIQSESLSAQIEAARLENFVQVKKEKVDSLTAQLKLLGIDDVQPDEVQDTDLVAEIAKAQAKLDDLEAALEARQNLRTQQGSEFEQMENEIRSLRRSVSAAQGQIHQLSLKQVSLESSCEQALSRLNGEYGMTYEFALTQKKDLDYEQAQEKVVSLQKQIRSLGPVNLDAPAEYKEVSERFSFYTDQKADLLSAAVQVKASIEEMDETMASQFLGMFNAINAELQGVFQSMFGGGQARLSLCDPTDILETGVDIEVQPPGKMVKSLAAFSGGEKALIAISVLFAILKARTIPLCIFDEVEAALDQANVERFARYLATFKADSQFIVVTHRPGTMEQCDCLYGVTMEQNGVSQVLKVLLKDALSMVESEVKA